MELKIWVEGIQRIVCGVTVNTTCQDIVYALAHATGKVGRFTLIERWRNNERLLAPTEYPLKLILKWGEYSSDVQFILQRSELTKRPAAPDEKGQSRSFSATILTKKQPLVSSGSDLKPHQQQPMHLLQQHPKYANDYIPLNRCKRLWKSFGSLETPKSIENVGIVTGVQQRIANTSQPTPTLPQQSGTQEKSISNISLAAWTSASDTISNYYPENPTNEINLKKNASNNILNSSENVLDIFNGNSSNNKFPVNKTCVTPDLTNTPPISSNGALVPPPYRHPPPPRNSPMQLTQQTQVRLLEYSTRVGNNLKKADVVYINSFLSGAFHDNFFQAAQYKDLIHLIKFQRDKITSQQSELTKYDAEIVYLENKERDQAQELQAISREITKSDQMFQQGSEQLQTLQYVEEENELVKQQEKTLKSEITLLRLKLTNCETELLECKNKIRILMDDIQVEHKAISIQQKENGQNVEREFRIEIERIQTEIDQAIHTIDSSSQETENLKKEINMIENTIAEKKRQVKKLINEMKEVNLQSLAVKPSDEIRSLLEGSNKPDSSSRRIIGSPRQLENAVPTSKNPHGVWV